jgi:cytochrome c-type biogenesis protein CcmE
MKVTLSIAIAIAAVLVLLLIQGMQQGSSVVLLPSQVLERGAKESLKRIRVIGRVTTQEILYSVSPKLELKFSVQDPPGSNQSKDGRLAVVYEGVKPDMFAAGRDVIIDGAYDGGELKAVNLLTQCPSKYEPPVTPGAKSE